MTKNTVNKENMTISKILGDTALKAQRQGWLRACLPPATRRRLGVAASRFVKRPTIDLVDDWSRPLVGAHGPVAMPMTAPFRLAVNHSRSTGANRTEVTLHPEAPRCLLAASSLDVSGMDEMVAFLALHLRSHGLRTAVLLSPSTPKHDVKARLAPLLSAAGIEVAIAEEHAARHWIRRWAPDVISAHEAPRWVLDEAHAMSIPYVNVLHGMFSLFGCDWTVETKRSRKMAAIVAVSELVRDQYLHGVSSFPSERIVTIPNGVDVQRRVRQDRSAARAALGLQEEFLFVCLARLCPQKNQFGLVSAFDEVATRHPDAHLLMAGQVGEPVYATQVRQKRDELVARTRVHLRDHATDPEFLLAAADGFVLNSFFEGWALASMEALCAGVPVVASDVGGAREQLGTDPSRGYLIGNPFGDPFEVDWTTIGTVCYTRQSNREELVEAMCALVREREKRATKREELAAESAARFDPDVCLRAHADLLLSCATDRMPSVEAGREPRAMALI